MQGTTITGDDIQGWADRMDASAALPDLVRRLLLASAQLRTIEFRSDGGVRYPGWDGLVIATERSGPFCPQGTSNWELSTDRAVKRKLNDDYRKRTADANAVYVAVTARRLGDRNEWVEEKTGEGRWKEVRAIDADDLATWLADAPAVALWFAAEHLGRPAYDLSTLEDYVGAWSHQTAPPLPRELLLLGVDRRAAAERVFDWADGAPGRLTISAETRDEALIFVAAAMLSRTDRDAFSAHAVVVRSEAALRWAERQRSPLILIPTIDARALITSTKHHVVLAVDREGARRPDIELGRIPFGLIEKELSANGFRDARRIARDSQGGLAALARVCGGLGVPQWASNPQRILLALLLAGEWSSRNGADLAALTALSGASLPELEATCARLSQCSDPPLRLHHDFMKPPAWRWSAPKDAWAALAPHLTDGLLDEFQRVVLDVLNEENPVFTMPREERFYASIHGKVRKHSDALRQGLAGSLARLSRADGALKSAVAMNAGSSAAVSIVRQLLRAEWIAWASLSDVLPLLAEAAPDQFLDALFRSLDAGHEGVVHLWLS